MKIENMVEGAKAFAQSTIDAFGPRLTGGKSCKEAADKIEQELRGVCDTMQKQELKVHPGAFLGWIRILVVLYLISVVMLWLRLPIVSVVLLALGILIMVLQFFFYKAFIDFLYPAKTGVNVCGVIEPQGEVKQQIIISGHHDSARVFNFFIHQPKLYGLRVTGGIGFLVFIFVCSIFNFAFAGAAWLWILAASLASLGVLLIAQLWFFASKKGTPGAGDNLFAVALGIEAMKEFAMQKKAGNGLLHTRVKLVSFDAEEEGLRGAKAYAIAHESEFKEIPTYVYNIDCPYYLKDLFFLTTDINTSVQLSEEMARECAQIASRLGYKADVKPITFLTGGTDAGELSKRGAHATTLMAMPWDNTERSAVYHTPNDTVDNVEQKVLAAALEIFMSFVKEKDEKAQQM